MTINTLILQCIESTEATISKLETVKADKVTPYNMYQLVVLKRELIEAIAWIDSITGEDIIISPSDRKLIEMV